MLQKLLWNDIARNGVLIGLVMSGFRLFDISTMMSGSVNFAVITSISNILSFVIYVVLVRYAVVKFEAKLPEQIPFGYMQSLSFISLTSILASVWVAFSSTVVISQVVGFENYIDGYISSVNAMIEMGGDSLGDFSTQFAATTIESLKSSKEPTIIDSIFGTAFIYIMKSLIVGVPLSIWTRRKVKPVSNSKEQADE
ncbi:MAG: DUF4199 family protein [Rikenellaceae bacterium]